MKQFPILNGKARIVELPAVSLVFEVHRGSFLVAGIDVQDIELKKRKIDCGDRRGFLAFQGRWQIVGMLPEVREEQLSEIVSFIQIDKRVGWYDYNSTNPLTFPHSTAIESLESAILAEGYYLDRNPIGDKHPELKNGQSGYDHYDDAICWAHAQSRVLDRSRCLLLERVDA